MALLVTSAQIPSKSAGTLRPDKEATGDVRNIEMGDIESTLHAFSSVGPYNHVQIITRNGEGWYVYHLSTETEPIYIAPVSADLPPLLYHDYDPDVPPILLIPLPPRALPTSLHIDSDYELSWSNTKSQYNFKTYVAIPQNLSVQIPSEIQFSLTSGKYGFTILGPRPLDESEQKISKQVSLYYPEESRIVHGLYFLTSVAQIKIEEKKSHPELNPAKLIEPTIPESPEKKIGCSLPTMLDFDTSGSMGRIPPEELAHVTTETLVRRFRDNYTIVSIPRLAPEFCGITLQELYQQRGFSGINDVMKSPVTVSFSKEGEVKEGKIDVPFTMFLDEGALTAFAGLKTEKPSFDVSTRLFLTPFVDEKRVEKWVQENILPKLKAKETFSGLDPRPGTTADIRITDNSADIAISTPEIVKLIRVLGGLVKTVISKTPEDQTLANGRSTNLPLFISTVLLDKPFESKRDSNEVVDTGEMLRAGFETMSEAMLQEAFSGAIDLDPSKRGGLYEPISKIIFRAGFDTLVKKRASALLSAWAFKGDTSAKTALVTAFKKSGSVEIPVRAYLARSASLLLTDAEREDIAGSIIPDDPENFQPDPTKIIALWGSPFYGSALRTFLEESWDLSVIRDFASIQQAVFIDPVTSMKLVEGLDHNERASLAGNPVNAQSFSDIYQVLADYGIPALSETKADLTALFFQTARVLLDPPWEEGTDVVINQVPEKRLWYFFPLSAGDVIDSKMERLAENADVEESWIEFRTNKGVFLFEIGLMANEMTAYEGSHYDWKEIGKIMAKRVGKDFAVSKIVHHHNHPASSAVDIHYLPSDNDFQSWLGTNFEADHYYSGSDVEFHVSSNHGTTVVTPEDDLTTMVEVAGKGGVSVREFSERIEGYMEFIQKHLEQSKIEELNLKLAGLFRIHEPIKRGEGDGR